MYVCGLWCRLFGTIVTCLPKAAWAMPFVQIYCSASDKNYATRWSWSTSCWPVAKDALQQSCFCFPKSTYLHLFKMFIHKKDRLFFYAQVSHPFCPSGNHICTLDWDRIWHYTLYFLRNVSHTAELTQHYYVHQTSVIYTIIDYSRLCESCKKLIEMNVH